MKVILCPSDVYKVRLVAYGRMRNKMPKCLVAKCWPFFMPGIKTFGTFFLKKFNIYYTYPSVWADDALMCLSLVGSPHRRCITYKISCCTVDEKQ